MKKFFKKVFKGIKKVVKPIGKALKKGLGKIGKALGPVGTLALSLMLPGIGAAWASFAGAGGLAATTGGVLGGVMKGIAAAGNAVGTVYSSVSSMVGSVVKAIPGVGDAYTKLANFTTKMMDKGRMSMGLPTSKATTAAGTVDAGNEFANQVKEFEVKPDIKQKSLLQVDDAIKVEMKDPELFTSGGDMNLNVDGSLPDTSRLDGINQVTSSAQPLQNKMSQFTQDDWDVLGIDKNVNRDFTDMELAKINDYTPKNIATSTKPLEYTKDLNPMEQYTPKQQFTVTKTKPKVASVISPDDVVTQQAYGDPQGITQVRNNLREETINIGQATTSRVNYDTIDVRTADLTPEMIKQNNEIVSTTDYFNKQSDRILADATLEDGSINPEYTDMNKNMVGLKRASKNIAGVTGGVDVLSTEEEKPFEPGVLPMLDTDINGATDYSQAYASAFQGAGYVGPNDFNSYANAGYYGGDPFSIAQYNRRVPTPQANIRIGG
tara:strand:- start:3038 stop:4513 length:1476 start_codon:yes stop_codon:yes gene_type:complete